MKFTNPLDLMLLDATEPKVSLQMHHENQIARKRALRVIGKCKQQEQQKLQKGYKYVRTDFQTYRLKQQK